MAQTLKQQFLDTFVAEHRTTMKVLNALPDGQDEFRPHPRSQTARELAWTFTLEQMMMTLALKDMLKLGGGFPKPDGDFRTIVARFDREFADLVELITSTPDARFNEGTVKFFTGPGTLGDFPVAKFCWFMLCDQIHHRGQFSVYLRLSGGKVPSIYGPSADEPWT